MCFIARPMKADQETEASPMKSLLQELDAFRALFRASIKGYASRLDGEMSAVRTRLEAVGATETIPAAKLRDIREMLTLLRHVEVKPEKGRRKDLKKLDSVVGDLTILVENW
jgi:hypothetical protein